MDQVEGESIGSNAVDLLEPGVHPNPSKTTSSPAATFSAQRPVRQSSVTKKGKVSQNGLPAQTSQGPERRPSCSRPPLSRPLSLEVSPQQLRASQEERTGRRVVKPPWRSGAAAPTPPTRSLTSPSLGTGGWMRRSESTCSVNQPPRFQAGRGQMRPATSLPHIAKGAGGGSTIPSIPSRPCLLVALRPLNLEQEKQTFFLSNYQYEPQFEYMQPEPRSVLERYKQVSGLFLKQVLKLLLFTYLPTSSFHLYLM